MLTLIQSNFEMVMSQNATLSGELDVLRESLTRLQSSANQTLADLSEKEAELRIQKRERFECESKLYAAATEQDRMKDQAHTMAGKLQQVGDTLCYAYDSRSVTSRLTTIVNFAIAPPAVPTSCDVMNTAGGRSQIDKERAAGQRRRQQVPAPGPFTAHHSNTRCSTLRQELGLLRQQLEDTRQLKDAHEKTGIVEKEKTQRLSAALLQVPSPRPASQP